MISLHITKKPPARGLPFGRRYVDPSAPKPLCSAFRKKEDAEYYAANDDDARLACGHSEKPVGLRQD